MPSNLKSYTCKKDFIPPDSVDAILLARDSSFIDYLFFHNVLDKFCWILKLQYASKDEVKRKRYRLDLLFQRYLLANTVRSEKAGKCLAARPDKEQLEFHLTKGWHNELVRSDPLVPDYLKIGTHLPEGSGPGSGGLTAWNIIQSYYAAFEFCASIAVAVDPSRRITGHKQLTREFNNHVLGKAHERLIFYPFSLSDATTRFPVHPAHCTRHYASYPRDPASGIADLEVVMKEAFKFSGRGRRTSLLDLLYALRLWANYTGVSGLFNLTDGGFKGFLMKNLGLIVFFLGGMAELAVLFSLGERDYLDILRRFSTAFIDGNERFARCQYLVPSHIRVRAYKHVGIMQGNTDFVLPALDPVQFVDLGPMGRD